jgi:RND superfamily putative drug exporter
VRRIRGMDAPSAVLVAGDTAQLVDLKGMLADRLGWVLLLISVATFGLLFLFTGSVLLPVKALLMNLLVAAAGTGIMVSVFQNGHLIGLVGGEHGLGAVDPMLPMFMTVLAFGVLLDYEIFLLSGIREEYRRCGDNTEAVAVGLARNGRLITSAACTLVISVGVLAISDILTIKLMGVVLTAGLIIDATLIRILLVPSFMRLAGTWNWWAPQWLEASRDAVSRFRDRDRRRRLPVAGRDHEPRAAVVGPGLRPRRGDRDAAGSL